MLSLLVGGTIAGISAGGAVTTGLLSRPAFLSWDVTGAVFGRPSGSLSLFSLRIRPLVRPGQRFPVFAIAFRELSLLARRIAGRIVAGGVVRVVAHTFGCEYNIKRVRLSLVKSWWTGQSYTMSPASMEKSIHPLSDQGLTSHVRFSQTRYHFACVQDSVVSARDQ